MLSLPLSPNLIWRLLGYGFRHTGTSSPGFSLLSGWGAREPSQGFQNGFFRPADSDFDHFLDKCLFMAEGLAATKLYPWRNRRHFFLVHEQEHLPAWAAIQFFAGLSVAYVLPAILDNLIVLLCKYEERSYACGARPFPTPPSSTREK